MFYARISMTLILIVGLCGFYVSEVAFQSSGYDTLSNHLKNLELSDAQVDRYVLSMRHGYGVSEETLNPVFDSFWGNFEELEGERRSLGQSKSEFSKLLQRCSQTMQEKEQLARSIASESRYLALGLEGVETVMEQLAEVEDLGYELESALESVINDAMALALKEDVKYADSLTYNLNRMEGTIENREFSARDTVISFIKFGRSILAAEKTLPIYMSQMLILDTAGQIKGLRELVHRDLLQAKSWYSLVGQLGMVALVLLVGVFGIGRKTWIALHQVREESPPTHELVIDNRRLEENVKLAKEASRAKAEFLVGVSHEIRTPLTAILGYTDILANEEFEIIDRDEAVVAMRRNTEHLLAIVGDVLDMSRLESSGLDARRSETALVSLIKDVQLALQRQSMGRSMQLEVEYKWPLPKVIETDPTRLRQILVNLVSNASRLAPHSEMRLVVQFESTDNGHQLIFSIELEGVILGSTELKQLFVPFGQQSAAMSRSFGGTGLGLVVARQLAKLLGGDLHTTTGDGRTRLAASIHPGALLNMELITELPAVVAKEPPSGELLAGRVLLAEDCQDSRMLISNLLRKAGVKATVAVNGQEALDHGLRALAQGSEYDLILMDMQMPELDGFSATRKLRAAGYEGPIVALTAHALSGDRDRCLRAGCSDYVAKPIDRQEFAKLLESHLQPASVSS